MSTVGRAAIIAAAAYLIALSWAMRTISYDLWGAMVVVPVLVVISVPLMRRAFTGPLESLRMWAWGGMFLKFAGAIAGYQVRFEAYGGAADAGQYHRIGSQLAGDVRAGLISPLKVVPTGRSTQFIEQLTGLVYTVVGSSRLGGFMVFTWFSYWGLVFFVKAAVLAIPGLSARRYLLALFAFPSLVYWGSSIGKEAFVGLCLGLSAYGIAVIVGRDQRWRSGLVLAAICLYAASRVRPHFAAVWIGAALIALMSRAMLDLTGRWVRGKRQLRLATVGVAAMALLGFAAAATVTLDYLAPPAESDLAVSSNGDTVDRFASIFDMTERQTTQGGSSFTPPNNRSPSDWPYAAFRTLTRPLITEARGFAAQLPAVEMTLLLFVGALSWRRLVHTPKLLLTSPYLVFALIALFTFGVAFASIGNLGILVRQRSLVLPLLLLFWCLPPLPQRPAPTPPGHQGRLVDRPGLLSVAGR